MQRILPILAVLLLWGTSVAHGQPVPNMPSDGAVDQPVNVTVGWRPLSTVVAYEVQVSMSTPFDEFDQVITAESSAELLNLLYQTTYYWRVRGVDAEWNPTTDWSAVQSFTVRAGTGIPQPVLPEEGASDQPLSVQLQWSGVPGAGIYEVQYAFDPGFLGGVNVAATDTTHLLEGLDYEQQVFWRVRRAFAAGAPGDWSRAFSFTTRYRKPEPPDAPRLLSPADNAVDQPKELTLTWNPVEGKGILYDVEVAGDEDFTEPIRSALDVDSTSFDLADLEGERTYFWRARARNGEAESEWSAPFRFTTRPDQPATPLAPQLLTPVNGSSQVPVVAFLTWDSIEDAAWYEMEFGRDPSFAGSDTLIRTGQASAEMVDLLPETTYHWRARAGNENGPSAWSRPFRFTTAADEPQLPETPRLLAPADAATDVETTARLIWLPAANAASYAIGLSATGEFNGEEKMFDALDTAQLLEELPEGTQFFWRVQGRNPFGESEWSATRSFTTAGGTTGVWEEKKMEGMRIYPVPATENLIVEIPAADAAAVRLELFDARGLLRMDKAFAKGEAADGRYVLPLEGIPAGIWYCRIDVDGAAAVRTVIVVR